MINFFDNLDNNNHSVSISEYFICFFAAFFILNNITLGTIFSWEAVIKSLAGIVMLVITLGVNDFYKEYLKPKFIKFIKSKKNGKEKSRKKAA